MQRLLFILIFGSVLVPNVNATEQWGLYVHVGGKGGHTELTNKCYPKAELMDKIPFAKSRSNFKWASDQNKRFSSKLIEIGQSGPLKIFDIHQTIEGGYYQYIKIILFENKEKQFCPFYINMGNNGNVQLSDSYLIKTKDTTIVASRLRTGGNGRYYLEHYYTYDKGVVKEIDVNTAITKVRSEIIEQYPSIDFGFRGATLDLERMTYSAGLYKKGACSACRSGGID
ncbi:MAG: hypothetical protein MJK04_28955, partial [Psychrosphaera sp.]|nr:hypothetical protein [Psychrosphaera sp.]